MRRVANRMLFIGSGHSLLLFTKKGVQIDFVSPKGGLVPIKQCDLDHQSVKDF